MKRNFDQARHLATQDRLRPERQRKMVARVAARKGTITKAGKAEITKAKYEAAMRNNPRIVETLRETCPRCGERLSGGYGEDDLPAVESSDNHYTQWFRCMSDYCSINHVAVTTFRPSRSKSRSKEVTND
jgi:hypothetical protein